MNKNYQKYITKKAIKSLWKFHKLPQRDNYKFIIAIPSFNEGDLIIETLQSISKQQNIDLSSILVIIVINNSDNENEEIIENNQKTFDAIKNTNFQNTTIITSSKYVRKQRTSRKNETLQSHQKS